MKPVFRYCRVCDQWFKMVFYPHCTPAERESPECPQCGVTLNAVGDKTGMVVKHEAEGRCGVSIKIKGWVTMDEGGEATLWEGDKPIYNAASGLWDFPPQGNWGVHDLEEDIFAMAVGMSPGDIRPVTITVELGEVEKP